MTMPSPTVDIIATPKFAVASLGTYDRENEETGKTAVVMTAGYTEFAKSKSAQAPTCLLFIYAPAEVKTSDGSVRHTVRLGFSDCEELDRRLSAWSPFTLRRAVPLPLLW